MPLSNLIPFTLKLKLTNQLLGRLEKALVHVSFIREGSFWLGIISKKGSNKTCIHLTLDKNGHNKKIPLIFFY